MHPTLLNVVTGTGLGVSHSSLNVIGKINPTYQHSTNVEVYGNAATGNLVVKDTPITYPRAKGLFELQMIFNHLAVEGCDKWRLNIPTFKKLPTQNGANQGDEAIFVEADGHEVVYRYENGAWLEPTFSNGRASLAWDSTHEKWVRTITDGTQEFYTADGLLQKKQNKAHNNVRFSYTNGLLTSILFDQYEQFDIQRNGLAWNIVYRSKDKGDNVVHTYTFSEPGLLNTSTNSKGAKTTYTQNSKSDSPYSYLLKAINSSQNEIIQFDYEFTNSDRKIKSLQIGGLAPVVIRRTNGERKADIKTMDSTQKIEWNDDLQITSSSIDVSVTERHAASTIGYTYINNQLTTKTFPDKSTEINTYDHPLSYLTQVKHRNDSLTHLEYTGYANTIVNATIRQANASSPKIAERLFYTNELDDGFFLAYRQSPMGRITEYRANNLNLPADERHYTKDLYTKSDASPATLAEWVATLSPTANTLREMNYTRSGQLTAIDEYGHLQADGHGIDDNNKAFQHTIFDLSDNLLEKKLLQTIKQPDSVFLKTTYGYDGYNRPTTIQTGQKKQSIDYVDALYTTKHSMSDHATVTETHLYNHAVTSSQAEGKTRNGNEIQLTEFGLSDDGNPHYTIDAEQKIQFTLHDALDNLVFEFGSNGIFTGTFHHIESRYKETVQYATALNLEEYKNKVAGDELTMRNIYLLLAKQGPNPEDRRHYEFLDSSARPQYVVDAENYITQYTYDMDGRITQKIQYKNAITNDQIEQLKKDGTIALTFNANEDRCTQHFFDLDGLLIAKKDPAGYITTFENDAAGRMVQSIKGYDPQPHTGTYELPIITDNKLNISSYCFYDAANNKEFEVDAEGYITQFMYLPGGLIYQSIRFDNKVDTNWYNNTSTPPALPKPSDADSTTTYQYDEYNRLSSTTDNNGKVTKQTYDLMDNVTARHTFEDKAEKLTGDTSRSKYIQYDEFGRVEAVLNTFSAHALREVETSNKPAPEKELAIKAIWDTQSTRYTYNKVGKKIQEIDSLGNITLFYYDDLHRPKLTINSLGAISETSYNCFNEITESKQYYQAISADLLKSLTGGFVTADIQALLISNDQDIVENFTYTKRSKVKQHTDAENYVNSYDYNAFGELKSENIALNNKSEPDLFITHEYDTRGNIVKSTKTGKGIVVTDQFEFNNLHNLCSASINAKNEKTSYVYDNLGRKTITTFDDKATTVAAFDSAGRIISFTDQLNAKTTHVYNTSLRTHTITNPENEISHITNNIFGESVAVVGNGTEVTTSHVVDGQTDEVLQAGICISKKKYNTEGLCTSITDGNGTETEMQYNETHQLESIIIDSQVEKLKTQFTLNTFGLAKKITNARGIVTDQAFDKRKKVMTKTLDTAGLSLASAYSYDGLGNTVETTKGSTNNPYIYKEKVTFDGIARKVANTIDPVTALRQDALNLHTQETNDSLGRAIVSFDEDNNKTFIFYDNVGNKRFTVDAVGNISEWIYNLKNQVIAEKIYDKRLDFPQFSEKNTLAELITHAQALQSANDVERLRFYDKSGRERFVLDKLLNKDNTLSSKVTEYTYNKSDKKASVTQYAKYIKFPASNNPTTADIVKVVGESASLESDRSTRYVYDALNRERFVIDAEGGITEKRYDNNNNIISHIQYSTALANAKNIELKTDVEFAKLITPNDQDRYVHYVYNTSNKPTFIIDAEGAVSYFQYSKTLKVEMECKFTDKIDTNLTYAQIKDTVKTLTPDPKKDRISKKEYDNADRIKKITDELGLFDSYEYDELSNEVEHKDKAGNVWKKSFDKANRTFDKTNPARNICSVAYKDGKLVAEDFVAEIKSTFERKKSGQIEKITLASNTKKARSLKTEFDAIHNPIGSDLGMINIDNPNVASSLDSRPESSQAINTLKNYDTSKKLIAEQLENKAWKFYIRDTLGNVTYELEPLEMTADGKTKYRCKHSIFNAFNEVENETTLANTITLDTSLYTAQGISLANLTSLLVLNEKEDREVITARNRKGKVTEIQRSNILYAEINEKNAAVIDSGRPTQQMSYNAFGELIRKSSKISNNKWANHYYWLNRNGMTIAECNPVNAVSTSSFDTFNKVSLYTEFADYISTHPTENMSFAELSALLNPNNPKNRQTKTDYTLRGEIKSETKLNVVRQTVTDAEGKRTLNDKLMNLIRSFTYTATGQEETITLEDRISQTRKYYDSNGLKIAEVGIAFDSLDATMQPITLRPLTYFGYDEHSNKVKTHRFFISVDKNCDLSQLPQVAANEKDQIDLELHNNLGLVIYKQDAEGHLSAMTYNETQQVARTWQKVTTFNDQNELAVVNIDETRVVYNLNGKETAKDIRRNNVINDITRTLRNTFGDDVAEDHGSDEWAIYTRVNRNGDIYNTNTGQGVSTVVLKDLAGNDVLKVISAAKDISPTQPAADLKDITEDELSTLLSAPSRFSELEQVLSKRDSAGRTLSNITPELTQFAVSHSIPLQMSVVEKLEDSVQKTYLTWLKQTDATFVADSIKLTAKGTDIFYVLPISADANSDSFTLDISHLPSDVYDYALNYYYISDATNKATVADSSGTIQCITASDDKSQNVVCTIIKNDTLAFTGDMSEVIAIEILQDHNPIARKPLSSSVIAHELSLHDLKSGSYSFKPILRNGHELAESPVQNVYSPIPASAPLSKEIPCAVEMKLDTDALNLGITVPDEFKSYPATLTIHYKSILGKLMTHIFSLESLAKNNFSLKIPEFFHEFVSFDLKMNMSNNQFIQLYQQEKPADIQVTQNISSDWIHLNPKTNQHEEKDGFVVVDHEDPLAESKEEQEAGPKIPAQTVTFTFTNRTFALITSSTLALDAKEISILDVSKDRYAQWRNISVLHNDANGFTVDVTEMAAGNYPFKLNVADKEHTLVVSHGHRVYGTDNTTAPSGEVTLAVSRSFTWDPWNNPTTITDSLQNGTDFAYNDLNKEILKTDPAVDCAQDDNSVVTMRPITRTGYNELGFAFASQNGRNNITSDILNQLGLSLTKILGDLTISQKIAYDIFARINCYSDGDNNVWLREMDRVNNILAQTSPLLKRTEYLYDELKQRVREKSPAPINEITCYLYNAVRCVQERRDGDGNSTKMTYDHNHKELSVTRKEGTLAWTRDPFGNAKTYTDMRSITSWYEYNHAKKLTRQRNNDINVRQWAQLVNNHFSFLGFDVDMAKLTYQNVMGQDIEYTYSKSHLLEMRDRSGLQLMRFKLDTEGHRIQTEIRALNPTDLEGEGQLLRIVTASLDKLGRETKIIDSNVMLDIIMDAAGNRRITTASILNDAHAVTVQKTANTFDDADRITGQVGPTESLLRAYKNNLVEIINRNGVITTITHDADHQVRATSSTDGKFSKREVDNANRLASFTDQTGVRTQTYYSGNSNIDTLTEHKNEKDTNSTTKFGGYDSFAESHNQHSETSFVDNGVHRQISDLASDFISTDTSLLVAAHSTVNLDGRVSSATAAQNYDPNLHLNTLVDIAAADGKEKQTIHILNTIEGKPLTKSTIGMITQSRGNRHNNVSMTYPTVKAQSSYFYTTNGDPLLSCEFDKATNVVTSTWQQFYATSAKGGVTTSLKSDPHFANLKQSIDTNPHSKIQNHLNTIPSPESTLTGQSQGVYISQEGDTFASIALTQFADSSFGTAIADYNGLSAGSPPPPGYKLKLPPMEAVHNNAGLYFPYAQFMNSMHTALQPYVVIPPEEIHKKHGSFWKLLTEVIVSSIALAVAPYAAPLIFGELAGIGAAIATGVTAGLLDATLQGVAVGAGLQDKFSINSMIETAALGGFLAAARGAAIANEASHATATRTMLAMGKASATSQLMELATGLRQKFDVKELMSSMASGYANARINMPNTDQMAGRVAANGVSTITGTAITSLVYRQDPNLQTMAAQMLGSSIGNEASQRINGVLAQRKHVDPEIPREKQREKHVRELAHTKTGNNSQSNDPTFNIDINPSDSRWSKKLSKIANDERQANHATSKGHGFLLDADRQSKYKHMLFGKSGDNKSQYKSDNFKRDSAPEMEVEGSILETIHQGLGVGGIAAGAGEFSNVVNGSWIGKNGKFYDLESKFFGNQHTGSKLAKIAKAELFNVIGRKVLHLDIALSLESIRENYLTHKFGAISKTGADLVMGAAAAYGGPIGWASAGVYTAVDLTIGWDRVIEEAPEAMAAVKEMDDANIRVTGKSIWWGPKI